jgi:hypothetical protein
MNGNDLLNGLSHVEDRYVEEAEREKPGRKLPVGWLSMAACLCVLVTVLLSGGFGLKSTNDAAMEMQSNGSAKEETLGEIRDDAAPGEMRMYFDARVVEILEGTILVEVTEAGSSYLTPGMPAYLRTEDGKLAVGDHVRVTFDGMVQESYPVQIPHISNIEIVPAEGGTIGHGQSYLYSVDEGPFADYIGGKVIEEEKLGEMIEDVTLTAGWKDHADKIWLTRESLRGEVYAIRGIDTDIAVALRFLDKGDAVTLNHYYVILNPEADLSSVEEYVIQTWIPNSPGEE